MGAYMAVRTPPAAFRSWLSRPWSVVIGHWSVMGARLRCIVTPFTSLTIHSRPLSKQLLRVLGLL